MLCLSPKTPAGLQLLMVAWRGPCAKPAVALQWRSLAPVAHLSQANQCASCGSCELNGFAAPSKPAENPALDIGLPFSAARPCVAKANPTVARSDWPTLLLTRPNNLLFSPFEPQRGCRRRAHPSVGPSHGADKAQNRAFPSTCMPKFHIPNAMERPDAAQAPASPPPALAPPIKPTLVACD